MTETARIPRRVLLFIALPLVLINSITIQYFFKQYHFILPGHGPTFLALILLVVQSAIVWFMGKSLVRNILVNKLNFIWVSFLFVFRLNILLYPLTLICLVLIMGDELSPMLGGDFWYFVVPFQALTALLFMFISTLFSTFTAGLLVAIISKRIIKSSLEMFQEKPPVYTQTYKREEE